MFAVFRDYSEILPTYELFMQNDINTKGSTQWFYFKVASKTRTKVRFKILNFVIFILYFSINPLLYFSRAWKYLYPMKVNNGKELEQRFLIVKTKCLQILPMHLSLFMNFKIPEKTHTFHTDILIITHKSLLIL